MRYLTILVAIFILSCNDDSPTESNYFETGEIKGKIRDYDTNQLVQGVRVYTDPYTSESTTGPGGTFQLEITESGSYKIKAERYGFHPTRNNIEVGSKATGDMDMLSQQTWITYPGGVNGTRITYEDSRVIVHAGNMSGNSGGVTKVYECENQKTVSISCSMEKDVAATRVGLFALLNNDPDNVYGFYRHTEGEHSVSFSYDVFDKTIDYINEIVVDTTYVFENGVLVDTVYVTIPSDTVYVDSTSFSIQLRVEGGSAQGYFWDLEVD